jgi:ADP-ribosylglycohydrolase
MENRNYIKDVLLGVSVADALGVPFEFKSRQAIEFHPATDMIGYGTYSQPSGTWSDDSSLTFCLAEALLTGLDYKLIAQNFINWLYNNHWTPYGEVFDVGNTTQIAIERLKKGANPVLAGENSENSNGNGSLMRILPLIFYTADKPIESRFELTKNISSFTHRHIRSVIACFYYLEFARYLMQGKEKFEIYAVLQKEIPEFLKNRIPENELKPFSRILEKNIFKLKTEQIRSSGYVIDTLEASLWSLLTTDTYKSAVLKCVNLGEDTDTTAAVCGGLAGLLYGYQAIPEMWISELARIDDILKLAERLSQKYPFWVKK